MMEVRPLEAQIQRDDDLPTIVAQIHHEYKGFRHVTEQEMLERIANGDLDATDVQIHSITKPEQEKGTLEFIAAKRATMMTQLDVALNDTMMLLDFTSLLEATYKRQPAEQTISAFLKTAMPVGSLAAENWVPSSDKKLQKAKDDEQQKITIGWKAESLSKAADLLLAAATRLRDNVEHETRYWAQILDVQEQGWTVFRSPVARSQLGVQTASTEAGAYFKECGLVTFKANVSGEISLKAQTRDLKALRVRIRKGGSIVSEYSGHVRGSEPLSQNGHQSLPADTSLMHIRDTLFEEELFHEMNVEARDLIPLGVTVRSSTIHIGLRSESHQAEACEISLDMISRQSHDEEQCHEPDGSARQVAVALRLLMSKHYQERRKRRTSKPPLMRLKGIPALAPRILTSLLTVVKHQSAVQQALTGLQSLCKVIEAAALPAELIIKSTSAPEQDELSRAATGSLRKISQFELTLPSAKFLLGAKASSEAKITIDVVTQLIRGPESPMGTAYFITIPAGLDGSLYAQALAAPKRFQKTNWQSCLIHVTELLKLDLTKNLLAVEFPSGSDGQSDPWLWCKAMHDGTVRKSCIYLGFSLDSVDERSEASRTSVSLGLFHTVVGKDSIVDSARWSQDSSRNDLLEIVRGWYSEAPLLT